MDLSQRQADETRRSSLRESPGTTRDAQPDELGRIADLIVEGFAEFRQALPAEVWRAAVGEWRDVPGRLTDSQLIVADVDGVLAGSAAFYPGSDHSRSGRWPRNWASIRALVVKPGMRGRGLGHALTGECLRRAHALGVEAVALHTAAFMVAAQATYERAGFRRDPAWDMGWLGDRGVALGTPGSIHAMAFRYDVEPGAAL